MLKTPVYLPIVVSVSAVFAFVLLFLDAFIFLSPYFTVFLPFERISAVAVDLVLALFTGIVMAFSIFQVRVISNQSNKKTRLGLVGAFTGVIAGACPCYYLFPLLAIAGGVGGILGTIGITFYVYQTPVKLALILGLILTLYTSERLAKSACRI